MTRTPSKTREMDRIFNILLGEALGDALGAPHELTSYNGEYTGVLHLTTKILRRYNEPVILDVGSISDDTQMTWALLTSLVKCRGYNREDVIMSYINFANTRPYSLGRNTRSLFKNIKTLKGYEQRRQKVDPNNQSNGTLMRASALAFLPQSLTDEQLFNTIRDEVYITNSHINNVIASYLYVRLLRYILFHPDKPTLEECKTQVYTILQDVQEHITPELSIAIQQGINGDIRDITGKTKGWVLHGLYCTIYALFHCTCLQHAIDTIVMMGGDTDTNAKIAGAVVSAYHGLYSNDPQVNEKVFYNIQVLLQCPNNHEIAWMRDEISINTTLAYITSLVCS